VKRNILKFFLFLLLPAAHLWSQSFSDIVTLIREGQREKAKKVLLQWEKGQEASENILFLHGLLSLQGDSAVYYYEQLLKQYPDSKFTDDALLRLAEMKYALGLYKTAQNQFQRILTEHPQSSLRQTCHYWIGLCFQAMGKADSAVLQFQTTINDFASTNLSKLAQERLALLQMEESPDSKESSNEPSIRYAVQVGAFTNQTNALLRKSFFESKGYQVDLRTKIKKDEVLYLVWVGSFTTREEARQFGENLKKRYDVKYSLVSE